MRTPVALPQARSGFTLFEVLVALAIFAVLMASLFCALDLCIRMGISTPQHLQQVELCGALLREMETDIRRFEGVPPHVTPRGTADGVTIRRSVPGGPAGLIGSETWLAGFINEAESTSNLPKAHRDARATGRLDSGRRFVLFTSSENGRIPQLQDSSVASRFPKLDAGSALGPGGHVVRYSASDLLPGAVSSRNTEVPVRREILATGVRLRFRYFDGTAWHRAWNSTERASFPHAIEVAAFPSDSSRHDTQTSHHESIWRMIVPLIHRIPHASAARRTGISGRSPLP